MILFAKVEGMEVFGLELRRGKEAHMVLPQAGETCFCEKGT